MSIARSNKFSIEKTVKLISDQKVFCDLVLEEDMMWCFIGGNRTQLLKTERLNEILSAWEAWIGTDEARLLK